LKLDFKNKAVLVVGDIIKDTYYFGSCDRISPEAPVPVVRIARGTYRLGGAGNVAKNIRRFGIETFLLTLAGDDSVCSDLKKACLEENIKAYFVKSSKKKTPEKIRVLSQNQQLLRLDFEDEISSKSEKDELRAVVQCFEQLIKRHNFNLIVMSDYKKGTLQRCNLLIKLANKLKIPVLVDPKGEDFSIYTGAHIIKPNLQEFQNVMGPLNNEKDVVKRARKLAKNLKLKKGIVLTKGAEGISFIGTNDGHFSITTPNIKEVYDVTGAGDTVIAALAACFTNNIKFKIEDALKFAGRAAAVAVGKLGTYSPSLQEVIANENVYFKETANVPTKKLVKRLSLKSLTQTLESCRKEGKKIVFTNGCFDVIHAGHAVLLKTARQCGDILVVGLNSDKSIITLKGRERPFHKLADRIRVLEEFECVDYIVVFDGKTPINLIRRIKPNTLVKGSEYAIGDIVGAKTVSSYGGTVKTVPMVRDLSTSKILNGFSKRKKR
tara:strand:+ start:811 stop:2289 length:1479 start_codon:yes stop_codon:yes gene_type:complete